MPIRREVSATSQYGWTIASRPRLFQRRQTVARRVRVMVSMMDSKEAAVREVTQQAFVNHLLYGVVTIDGGLSAAPAPEAPRAG